MKVRINDLKIPYDSEEKNLPFFAAKALGIKEKDIGKIDIIKKSLDARRKNNIQFIYTVDAVVEIKKDVLRRKSITKPEEKEVSFLTERGSEKLLHRPVVIGAGPAGLMAAYVLAANGYRPLLLERGKKVEERIEDAENFWSKGDLSSESNIGFGEGGAGTFSDGKLRTRIKNPRVSKVLQILIESGAPKEIAYHARPHIGTDQLCDVLIKLRDCLLSLGGDIRFESKVTNLSVKENKIVGLIINDQEEMPVDVVITATGHSARDTYEMFSNLSLAMEAKPFAIGLRIEHPQKLVDTVQFGEAAGHPNLPPAEYQLAYQSSNKRGVYTFCMCPGGYVIGAATEQEKLTINGMSEHARDGENANSALVVSVDQRDMNFQDPLCGIRFQRQLEAQAFQLGGGNYKAPVQKTADFLAGKESSSIGEGSIKPTYRPGVTPADLARCLPDQVAKALKEGLWQFNRKMPIFLDSPSILTGVETRTSSPVRLLRDNRRESISIKGLYPAGEGAGYAGGIVSSGVDGMESAEALIKRFQRPKY